MIHIQYEHIPIVPNVILQFHRDLYRQLDSAFAGNWKDSDNQIQEQRADGTMAVRFQPTSVTGTPAAIETLCNEYDNAIKRGKYDPLILSAMFVFDFASIHPFIDGNGRMSRLLTLLALYKSNYLVGKYISIEREITDACPTVSSRTAERVLKKLQGEGSIEKIGAARSTRYRRIG